MERKTVTYAIGAVLLLAASFACSKQDDIYKPFVKPGGYVYPAKVQNLTSVPGYCKVQLFWDMPKDPSLRTFKVFWNNYADSLAYDYSQFSDGRVSVEVNSLAERSYTFNVVNYDSNGNKSLAAETTASPFGVNWLSTHIERTVVAADMSGDDAVVIMSPSTAEMAGTRFRYRDTGGNWVETTARLNPDDTRMVLPGAMGGKRFEYMSGFISAESADTVWTGEWVKSSLPIRFLLDTSGWKVTATTGQVEGSNTPDKIFDGVIDNAENRWQSSLDDALRTRFPKILSIDTGRDGTGAPTISAFTFYLHPSSSSYRYIKNYYIYIGDTPFDPDDASFLTSWGDYARKSTLYRTTSAQGASLSPARRGRYIAIVFTDSQVSNGQLDLWELTATGYVEADAD